MNDRCMLPEIATMVKLFLNDSLLSGNISKAILLPSFNMSTVNLRQTDPATGLMKNVLQRAR